MENREVLAELKISWEYLQDIKDNYILGDEKDTLIKYAMNIIAEIYSDVRENMYDDECMINIKGKGTYYIGGCVSQDYMEVYNDEDNSTEFPTCADLGYFWYEDKDFIMGAKPLSTR